MKKDELFKHADRFFDLFPKNVEVILGGGFIRCFFEDTPFYDVDFFVTKKEDIDIIKSKLNTIAEKKFEDEGGIVYKHEYGLIDVIKRPVKDADDYMNQCDFTIGAACIYQGELYFHPDFFEHILTKELVVVQKSYTVEKLLTRISKYSRYGYYFSKQQAQKAIKLNL